MKIGNTYLSELLGDRFDVSFQLGNNASTSFIKHNPHKPLGEIAEFSSESWDQKSIFADIFPYIEIGNVDITTGEISAIEPISIKDAPSRAKKIVRKNDILVSTTRPNRGAICLYEQDEISIASTGFSIIRNIDNNIIRDFLFVMLRMPFSLEQMRLRSSGGNYPAIIESELKKILIPIPQKEVQEHIINIYSKAQQARLEKQQEAKQLLESIDDYLLEALKIKRVRNTNFNKVSIIQNISSLLGGRLDPQQFHQERVEAVEKIKMGNWCRLKDVRYDVKSVSKKIPSGETYIGMENIDSCTGDYMESKEKEIVSSAARFKEGDILFPKLRPYLNKVHRSQFDGYCSTEFHVFEAHDILPDFLTVVLRSSLTLAQTKHLMTGNTLPRLQTNDVEDLILPNPEISKQEEIVKHIYGLKDKAKQLQKEGDALLEEAKQKIEKMIIG